MALSDGASLETFSYMDRPASHFNGRWGAMSKVMERDGFNTTTDSSNGKGVFADGALPRFVIDLGSCSGYFSLILAKEFPHIQSVVGVEGSVGLGNGTIGESGGNHTQITETQAVRIHSHFIQKLQLENCKIAPAVWSYKSILNFEKLKLKCDCLLWLSVFHHIDAISHDEYDSLGLSMLEGALDMATKLLKLSDYHIIELPNENHVWLKHVYSVYKTPHRFLIAVARRAWGSNSVVDSRANFAVERQSMMFSDGAHVHEEADWLLESIYKCDWYGTRETFLLRKKNITGRKNDISLDVHYFFPTLYQLRPAAESRNNSRDANVAENSKGTMSLTFRWASSQTSDAVMHSDMEEDKLEEFRRRIFHLQTHMKIAEESIGQSRELRACHAKNKKSANSVTVHPASN